MPPLTAASSSTRRRWTTSGGPSAHLLSAGLALWLASCSTPEAPPPRAAEPPPTPAPTWLGGIAPAADKLCGFGVAGAGYDANSPYPRQLAESRAVTNIAGVLTTRVQEAFIDRQRDRRQEIHTAHHLTIDESLIEQVAGMAQTEFWLDVAGEGPFAIKGYTYALSCIEARSASAEFGLDAPLAGGTDASLVTPDERPAWLQRYGTQSDGRLCAVGFSLPTFHADKTFQNVVDDIRWQLAEVIQTFVSSYYEELTTERSATHEAMTLATTEAVSRGAIVTHFWYDRDGVGPMGNPRSTYGYGCVYPVQILQRSADAVEQSAPPEERPTLAKVRDHAASAFEALDAELQRQQRPPPTTDQP